MHLCKGINQLCAVSETIPQNVCYPAYLKFLFCHIQAMGQVLKMWLEDEVCLTNLRAMGKQLFWGNMGVPI
jgi:hypothetical protein